MPSIKIPTSPTPGAYVRYARGNKVPAALLLFGLVIGLMAARRHALPSKREAAGLAIASLIIALASSYVPDLVTYFLLALLFVMALDATDAVTNASRQLLGLLTPATAG